MFVATTTAPSCEKFIPSLNRYINSPEFLAKVKPSMDMAAAEIMEHWLLYGENGVKPDGDILARVHAKLALMEGLTCER